MRLKSVFISRYKNLREFSLDFDSGSFIDVFVGKNGSGKSNFFEALIEIFRHLDQLERNSNEIGFDYRLKYEIGQDQIDIEWTSNQLKINGRPRRTLGTTPFPDNVLIYYSGHNTTVSQLVARYESDFSESIKDAGFEDSRRFIGIGQDYKSLLLSVLLAQPQGNTAREFVCQRLGIAKLGILKPGSTELTEPVIRLVLQRPEYAKGKRDFDVELNDETDRYWKAEGITKTFLDGLTRSIEHTPGDLTLNEGFFRSDDRYILYISIAKLQQEFAGMNPQDLFRAFDGLKTLGMLAEISVPLLLTSGVDATADSFSDGQFQLVYIYAILELFKDRNCVTLLDEPDAFLHPEWQFQFLEQVSEITGAATKNNHVLMSSHSASTVARASEDQISLIEFDGNRVQTTKVSKTDLIRILSAGLIAFSETEARLNINVILRCTTGAVLFTEGITDEIILETAWSKLYPSERRPFEIQNAFDRSFLRNLFARDDLRRNFPNRTMFALFDFDEAYEDWKCLEREREEVTDPHKGLAKQLRYIHHYAMLLPVPDLDLIKCQVLDPSGKPWGRGVDSHLSIELLFFKHEWLGQWFRKRPMPGRGEIVEFFGNKATFANDVVRTLPANSFELFKPIFEFVLRKSGLGSSVGIARATTASSG